MGAPSAKKTLPFLTNHHLAPVICSLRRGRRPSQGRQQSSPRIGSEGRGRSGGATAKKAEHRRGCWGYVAIYFVDSGGGREREAIVLAFLWDTSAYIGGEVPSVCRGIHFIESRVGQRNMYVLGACLGSNRNQGQEGRGPRASFVPACSGMFVPRGFLSHTCICTWVGVSVLLYSGGERTTTLSTLPRGLALGRTAVPYWSTRI